MKGEILAIEQRPGSNVTLDSLDLKDEYLILELVEHIVNIQIRPMPNQVTKVGSLMGHDRQEDLEQFLMKNSNIFV